MRILQTIVMMISLSPAFAQEAYYDAAIDIEFPTDLADFDLIDRTVYPQSGSGYSMNYKSPAGLTANIYVYDLGIAGIPDGVDNELISEALGQAIGDILWMVDNGRYEGAYSWLPEVTFPEGFMSTCILLEFRPGRMRRSCIFMRGHGGHFIKVRVSGANDGSAAPAMRELMEELIRLLAKSRLDTRT